MFFVSYMDKFVKIRIENTINLVNTRFDGNWTSFAKKIQKSRSYLSDIKNGHKQQFTEKLARLIEDKCDLPEKSLDHAAGEETLEDKVLLIPIYDLNLFKLPVTEFGKKHKDTFPVAKIVIDELNLKSKNLLVFIAHGDSMSPTIEHNSKVIIDTSQTTIEDGKIYALSKNNEIFIRRVFKQVGSISYEAKSDNDKFGKNQLQTQQPN
jgi:phage repressor protein C with HTH and peptisase S24 domain